jgi:ATP-dependent RNA helicase DOB1
MHVLSFYINTEWQKDSCIYIIFISLFLHLQVKYEEDEFDWGIIINFKKQSENMGNKRKENPLKASPSIIVDVLLHVSPDSSTQQPRPCPSGVQGDMEVIPVLNTLITHLSSLRIYYPKDLRPQDNRKSVLKTIAVSYLLFYSCLFLHYEVRETVVTR